MSPDPGRFRERSREALRDQDLREALTRFTGAFVRLRTNAQSEIVDWQEARETARRVKQHTIDHLGHYLREFEARLTERGTQVLWARDAEEARGHVLRIAGEQGCRRAVKSKSMTSEEIGLNHALEAAGIRTVETDLGEYVAQLAGEPPSHILAPIIHKTRQDVGRLFAQKLGVDYTEEVEVMTRVARGKLREEFLSADLGISGANFGIAETGTLVVVENEGNARLVTTLPRVHIALMGIEKLLPRLSDLALFLPLLIRAATGQRMSSYVSLLQGPGKDELDGPEIQYLILLDNGRTEMLADPVLRSALHCIRCSACLNVCPVYQRVGGHSYESVYPGPIGSVVSPMLVKSGDAGSLPFASTLCGACAEVCPVKIPLPEQLVHLRARESGRTTRRQVAGALKLWSFLLRHPRLKRVVMTSLGLGQKLPFFHSLARRLPVLSGWASSRDLPRLGGGN